MPTLNGSAAKATVYAAMAVVIVLILAITYIVSNGQEIPDVFILVITTAIGFLFGTRVIPRDAAANAGYERKLPTNDAP